MNSERERALRAANEILHPPEQEPILPYFLLIIVFLIVMYSSC